MNSFGLKAITVISAIAFISGALTGCSPTPKPAQAVTKCQDLSNPDSWSSAWSYSNPRWNHGSRMYSGFGLYKCSESATLTMRFTPLGYNFVAGTTYLSYGAKQITVVNGPTPGTKWFGSDAVVEVPSGITTVAPNQTFQPVVEITASKFGLTRGKEPVRAVITLKAKGKKSISFVKTIEFDNTLRFSVSTSDKGA